MKTPFTLIHNGILQFLFLFINADGFYITSRYALYHGWIAPGCSNMHQAIELYIKAILKLNYEQEIGHDLIKILKKYEDRDNYFTKILQNPEYVELLKQLSIAYLTYRYGEAGANSNSREIIEMLDEIAFNLRNIYLRNINSTSNRIYIPSEAQAVFLKNNHFFNEASLTNSPLASLGLPIEDELFDEKKAL